MRFKISVALMFAFSVLFSVPTSLRSQPQSAPEIEEVPPNREGPAAFLPLKKYEFPSVLEGEEVIYNFVIQSRGTEPLKIEKIITSCGCTVAFFKGEDIPPDGEETTKEDIPPGGEETTKEDIPPGGEETTKEDIPPGGEETTKEDIPPGGEETTREDIPPGGEETTKEDIPLGGEETTKEDIPPGGEEIITVKVDTKGRWGRLVKTATIYTNDKEHPMLGLTMRGDVERFATLIPERVRLNGSVGHPIEKTVRIIAKENYPFKILKAEAKKGKNISLVLNEVKKTPDDAPDDAEKTPDDAEKTPDDVEKTERTEYLLTVKNLMKERSRYYDTIILETDSPSKPRIKISVSGNIFESGLKKEK
ncbi:DUF1573 domain-containing protein [Desulfobacterales bacterium HSG2]|nr:DUF1573 domain-containing protein [Desulfobacterales bacterium HSG2]